ncbi:MAG TPA: site-2 protease family protein [Pyrinomonadaceae bacterium]|jgi:Zn-dependent protease|nr:site-2 protease family protein [Pyrinomonadaceae bacterium]
MLQNIFKFFKRQLLIFRLFGIPVFIDYRWFLLLILMTVITALSIPSAALDDITGKLILGFITTVVLFACVFGHELGHALAARIENIRTLEIVLHPFGGLARLSREPDTPRAEFRIAIAGPVASFFIAMFFFALGLYSGTMQAPALSLLLYLLFFFNILLAVFNLFPGYPLDGGRVLRAFLWNRGYDLNEATILTGRSGQIIALALMVFGLFVLITRLDFTGLWTILVGLFLFDSASEIISYSRTQGKMTVAQIMAPPFTLDPEHTVSRFIDRTLPLVRQPIFPVAKNKQLFGVLMLEDLKSLAREDWHETLIATVMRPVKPEYFVEQSMPVKEARELMAGNGIEALCVIDEKGNLIGFLQPDKIKG